MRALFPKCLPAVFLAVFALSRWPGLMPQNFSSAYALMFCAGLFFPGRLAWAGPLGVMLLTDLALNCWYQFGRGVPVFTPGILLYLAGNYLGYAALIGLGRWLRPVRPFLGLLAGGLLGAVAFYLVTNTAAWLLNPFRNPEYTRDLAGWIIALTKGTGGYPETWTFFRNTLLSGGLFTALFAGAWRWTAGESPREKGEEEPREIPGAEAEEPRPAA